MERLRDFPNLLGRVKRKTPSLLVLMMSEMSMDLST